jgi:hypothetical protein
MRFSWLDGILVGVVVFVGASLLPKSMNENEHALIVAAIAAVASLIVRRLPLPR